jgi:hypothetical protein
MPRYRSGIGSRSSGYCTVIGFWSRYLPVILMPTSVVFTLFQTFEMYSCVLVMRS